jgi:hypothetical protein
LLNTFMDWFKDNLVQSMLISPIMGVFFSILLTGMNNSPSGRSQITVIETKRVYIQNIYQNQESRKTKNDGGILIAVAFIMFLVWGYTVHFEVILNWIQTFILTAICFSFTTILISIFKGHFNSKSWWSCIVIPFLLQLFCLYLVSIAKTAIESNIVQLAKKATPDIYGIFNFYFTSLTPHGWIFLLTQLIGVILLCILFLFSTLMTLHYLALMNQRGGSSFWIRLTSLTWKFSSPNLLITFIFALISFLLLKGYIANWWNLL